MACTRQYKAYYDTWPPGVHGLVEGQRGGGLQSLIKAEKEVHPQRHGAHGKGFLRTEEIREGFLEELNPELSLKNVG